MTTSAVYEAVSRLGTIQYADGTQVTIQPVRRRRPADDGDVRIGDEPAVDV